MAQWSELVRNTFDGLSEGLGRREKAGYSEAEAVLRDLASAFFQNPAPSSNSNALPNPEARYRALVEQIPAVVFMANLDGGKGEAYVSPQIEEALGFTQEEWLQDPVRWYAQIHPDDKDRWSTEAAELFVSGKPLRSAYRVLSRDGRVIWFHCEAKMIRRENGEPWFIHGVGFDITDLKQTEEALEGERNVLTAILDTVGALIVVTDPAGRIIRFNRSCEQITGYSFAQVRYRYLWELFTPFEEAEEFRKFFENMRAGKSQGEFECHWMSRSGERRLIAWSGTVLPSSKGTPACIIQTGIDITERKQLEAAIMEAGAREQRRIGQDLHDGLGQQLTGIAFMSKVQEQKLAEQNLPYAQEAAKIVRLVNEAINKTRQLAKGLLPVVSEARGLMGALQQLAQEGEDLFNISCSFECEHPVLIYDVALATHLYHIAQEALTNAVKHGHAGKVQIALSAHGARGVLTVQDDGRGLAKEFSAGKGMGQHIMLHRAKIIGGTLDIRDRYPKGVIVSCQFPIPKEDGQDEH